MKKLNYLIVFVMLSVISTTTFAQEVKEKVKKESKEMLQKEKVEVQLSELPEAVTDVLGDEFDGYIAKKAYKATKDNKEVFYIKLEKEGKYIKVLIDTAGQVIEKKEIEVKAKSKLG